MPPDPKRPSPDARRAAILRAAATVFFEQGYAATSIDAIIERTGGSKRNIYREFGSKEGLFTALVSEAADEALQALAIEATEARDLRGTLERFAHRLLTVYMSPGLTGVLRVIMAEAFRFPDLAGAFYDKGPGRASARLAAVLAAARDSGEIAIDDCTLAADQFVGMLRGNIHLQVVLGLRPPLTPAEIDASAKAAVAVFLDGVGGARAPHACLPPAAAASYVKD